MRKIISKEEYEGHLNSVLYSSRLRFYVGCVIMYMLISIILDFVFGGMGEAISFNSLRSSGIKSVIWGVLFTLIYLPVMKMIMKNNPNVSIDRSISEEYDLCLPCSHKKTKMNSIGGVVYIAKNKLLFKPHKMNVGSKELVLESKEIISVNIEKQEVTLLTKLMYKNIPNCLAFNIDGDTFRFIVPELDKVMDVLEEEGLSKSY